MGAGKHAPAAPQPRTVRERCVRREEFRPQDFHGVDEPVILRGLVADWPAVEAARDSDDALLDYLLQFDRAAVVPVSVGPAELAGRVFYTGDFTGVNVDRGNAHFGEVLRRVRKHGAEDGAPLIYLASTDVDYCMPGFRAHNDLDFGALAPLRSVWIGTGSRIAAHNDLPLNIACVVAGKRRFTLFPPDQLENLYVGPFELTPAGRPISLVDIAAPDFERFPCFADALAAAQVADLEPGDALYLPSMWWHAVEATGTFNFLLNYWWRTVPSYLGTPQDVLTHAMLTLRDLPETEREIWRNMFEYYVFGAGADTHSHIPEHIRGVLAPITDESARRIRASLLNRLNR